MVITMSVYTIKELVTIMKENHLKILEVNLHNESYKIELFDNIVNSNLINTPMNNITDSKLIKSPMVGTIYRQKNPNIISEEQGDEKSNLVHKGDVLCVIEAMKAYHEIKAEEDCEIIEICFTEGQPVEYGQTIFKVRK